MRAYQGDQISGDQWPQATPLMLHQVPRESELLPEPKQGLVILDGLEKQMTAFAAEHEAVLKDVRRNFVLTQESVVTFLCEHRTLAQILLEAAGHLKACFGMEVIFTLRAPVDDSGSRSLHAVAMWPGKMRDVRNALARFDETWWIAHSRQASGYLTFTYELV